MPAKKTLSASRKTPMPASIEKYQPLPRELAVPEGALKIFAYFLSLLFPPLGFLLGIIFYPQPGTKGKTFGQQCMMVAGIGLVLGVCIWGLFSMIHLVASNQAAQSGYYF